MSGAAVLQAEDFAGYPPQARSIAEQHISLLRSLPVPFTAVLLRELSSYDWRFPAERRDIDRQLRFLAAASPETLERATIGFSHIPLSPELLRRSPAVDPGEYVEAMTAYLWSAHEINAFHAAAHMYAEQLDRATLPRNFEVPKRFCAVAIGRGAANRGQALFRKLRPHGTLFENVNGSDGMEALIAAAKELCSASPEPYAHWYVDGALPAFESGTQLDNPQLQALSYDALAPLRQSLLHTMEQERTAPGVGPEQLRSALAQFHPGEHNTLGLSADPVVSRFQLSLLTEGSGTQIFSTSFVQWAARELLRRAQPRTLVMRYAPRQANRPLNDLLLEKGGDESKMDPEGSLVDADMGAYYTWLNLSRIAPASHITFLAWFEAGTQAVMIAPGMPKGAASSQPCTIHDLLRWSA